MKPTIILGVVVLCACAGVRTGGEPARNGATRTAITETDLRHRLYLIADDSMGGRATGTPGHLMVTDYIAAEMRRLGIQPAGDNGTYFQHVPFVHRTVTAAEWTGDGVSFTAPRDLLVSSAWNPPSLANLEVIYGGVLGDTTTYISQEQANGKFVILSRRDPGSRAFQSAPANNVRFRDAAALAVTNFTESAYAGIGELLVQNRTPSYSPPGVTPARRPAAMYISNAMASQLLGGDIGAATTGKLGRIVSGRIQVSETPVVARNVVAVLPGNDPSLRGQYVAIGAHSDHDPVQSWGVDHDSLRLHNAEVRKLTLALGRYPNQQERAGIRLNLDSIRKLHPVRRDSIYNGADDDGSGTVAVLEIAEAMASAREKPKRSILFIWHVAEELGLIGANYFTQFPTVPRDSIVTQLNLDMIGRGGPGEELGGGPDYLQLIGWRRLSNQLGDVIEAVNREQSRPFKFDLQYDAPGHPEQYYCRSDHYMYARYGIPVAFFSTGDHGDYHQVTDEPQYIDYTKLYSVTKLIHDVTMRVAGLPQRPVVDGPVSDNPFAPCRQ